MRVLGLKVAATKILFHNCARLIADRHGADGKPREGEGGVSYDLFEETGLRKAGPLNAWYVYQHDTR